MTRGPLESIVSRLTSLRSYYTRYQVITGLLLTFGIIIAGLLFASLLSSVWALPSFMRLGLLGLFPLVLTTCLAYFVIRPLLYRPSLEKLALKVEEHYPQLSDRLISALQLQKQFVSNPEGYSLEMIEAVVYQAEKLSSDLDFKSVVDKRNLRKFGKITGSLAIMLSFFALVFPGNFKFALYAFSNPLTQLQTPAKFGFEISPGNKEIVKYSDLEIGIKLTPSAEFGNLELPGRLKLFYKFENNNWESISLKKIDRSLLTRPEPKDFDFAYTFKEVKRNFQFYAWAEGEKSPVYKIAVVDKPRVVDLQITLNFPAYTGLKPQVLSENEGNIKALAGTRAKIQVKSNKILEEAGIVFSDGSRPALAVNGKVAAGEIRIARDLTYHIEVTDENGNTNPDPIEYQVTVVPDEYPSVDITYPGEDRDLDESMRMPLKIAVKDDFGCSSLKIKYKINSGGRETSEAEFNVPFPKNTPDFVADYDWLLAHFPIVPGDYLTYRAEGWDNDVIRGPKKGESRTYSLRLPTLDEIMAEVAQEQSGQISQLEEVFSGASELKKKLENLTLDLESQKGQSWEKSQEFESALEQQKQIFQKVEEIKNQLEQTLDKMARNQLVRQEVAQKMQEIQKIMQEIATPEMKELMKKLQEALKKLDWEKIKASLKDFKLSQEELLKRLDQTLALLKRIQAEQKLDAMTKMLEQMAEKQEQINEQVEKSPEKELSQFSEQEKSLGPELENVAEQLEEFKKLMQEMPLLSQEEMQQMESGLGRQENQENISSMSEQLGMRQKKEAHKTGQKLASSFQKAAQQFSQMAKKLSQDQQKELLAKMQNSLQDLLYLSEEQEKLSEEVKQSLRESQELRDLAGQQKSLETATQQVAQNMEELIKQSSQISRRLTQRLGMCTNQMSEAASELSNRNSTNALSLQAEAMGGLNQVARDLLDVFNQSCNNPSSGMCSNPSLAQGLETLSLRQQQLNQSTGKLSDLLQDMMLPDQEELQKLAGQQAGIQKSLEELLQEYTESANALGRLERLAEEIQEAARQLAKGELDEELKRRQNRILNRLLDAQKSLYTQDYSKQRRAERGEDILRKSPAGLNLDSGPGKNSEQEKLEQEKYPAQYEEMIKSYFKALKGVGGTR